MTKQRQNARMRKLEAQNSEVDIGHIEDEKSTALSFRPLTDAMARASSTSSDTGPLRYGKAGAQQRSSHAVSKGASLIFPSGVEGGTEEDPSAAVSAAKRNRVQGILQQTEAVRFAKKKLILENMELTAAEIPLKDLCGTPLGNTLYKLSLSGNRLSSIPERLVQHLPVLRTLDLSQCDLVKLPAHWNLPQLRRLDLSHNRLSDFPEEVSEMVPRRRYHYRRLLYRLSLRLHFHVGIVSIDKHNVWSSSLSSSSLSLPLSLSPSLSLSLSPIFLRLYLSSCLSVLDHNRILHTLPAHSLVHSLIDLTIRRQCWRDCQSFRSSACMATVFLPLSCPETRGCSPSWSNSILATTIWHSSRMSSISSRRYGHSN